MFGYVIPDKQNMYIKDFNVFQAFYCGLCKTLGKTGSQITRLCTNYDMTFYNVLLHSLCDCDVRFERKVCLYNCRKKVVDCSRRVVLENGGYGGFAPVYYNAEDDVTDGKKPAYSSSGVLRRENAKPQKTCPKSIDL